MKTIPKEDLLGLFSKFKPASRNHIISSCPFCGKDDHFYINTITQLFDCKKCGEDGNIFKLLNYLGKLYLIGDFKSIERSRIKLLGDYDSEEDEKIEIDTPNRKLPIGFKRVFENDYLKTRKLVKRNFEDNIIGVTNLKPSLKNYIIFSIDEMNGCKGFVSRYTKKIPEDQKKFILRYRNDKGANFSKLLYGFDKVTNRTKTLILVEGLIDKITLDNFLRLDLEPDIKCVATFGKKISQSQILKMLEAGVENIILIFDYDAIKEMKKFSLELYKFFNVEIGYTFKKDINDSNDFEIGQIFENLKNVRDFNKKTVKLL
jgi:DNA primase